MSSTSMAVRVSRPPNQLRPAAAARSQRAVAARRPALAVRCSAAASSTQLPQSLQTLVQAFQSVPDPMARYKQLLFYATKLEPFPADAHTEDNKVKGCVSQVWVTAELRDGKLWWKADSDSQLTKGLAALLVQGLSGLSPAEIVTVPADFITQLGLQQSLTPSRNNGFLNMFKLMQKKALDTYLQQQDGGNGSEAASAAAAAPANGGAQAAAEPAAIDGSGSGEQEGQDGSVGSSNTPVADSIRRKLTAELAPLKLDVVDNSHQHAGHMGHRGSATYSGETHFTVEVVSPRFDGLSSLKRHRLVYGILDEELRSPVHALSLVTKTPAEAGMA